MAAQGQRSDSFPTTQRSALHGLKSDDPAEKERSLERVANAYWKPVYKYVRLRWKKTPAEAEEITQSFFFRAIDKGTFVAFDPGRGRFRPYVRVCVDRFVLDAERHDAVRRRIDRPLPFDFQQAEGEVGSSPVSLSDPEAMFAREWVRTIFEGAVESLRSLCSGNGKDVHYRIFEMFHLADDAARVTYADAAATLGLSVTDVNNRLSYARRAFRAIVLGVLREVTGDEQELREEARDVLGLEL